MSERKTKQPVAVVCHDGKRCKGTHPLICRDHGCAILAARAAAADSDKARAGRNPAFDCSALLAEAARLEQTAARMEAEAKTVYAPTEEMRRDFAARRLGKARQASEAARALRWAASANESSSATGMSRRGASENTTT